MELDLIWLTNTCHEFYPLMGKYLSRRHIVKEIGGPVWDDDEKMWLVAKSTENTLLGFCGMKKHKKIAHFCSDYVMPENRGKGIHCIFLQERIKKCSFIGAHYATATVTPIAYNNYSRNGFIEKSRIGSYRKVVLDIKGEKNGT